MNRDDRGPTLRSLRELDGYEVADADPNPLGWTVATGDGQQVGEVKDLVVDTTTMKVLYFDVALDDEVFDLGTSGQVLIPAQTARLSAADRRVIVPSDSPDELFQYISTQGAGIASWDTTASRTNPTAYAHDLPAPALEAPAAARPDTAIDIERRAGTGAHAGPADTGETRTPVTEEEGVAGKRPTTAPD